MQGMGRFLMPTLTRSMNGMQKLTFFVDSGKITLEVINVILKDRLKIARTRANMTQAEVAQKCGFASSAGYRNYEMGRIPTATTLAVLADALNVSSDWLIGLSSNMEIHDRIPLDADN